MYAASSVWDVDELLGVRGKDHQVSAQFKYLYSQIDKRFEPAGTQLQMVCQFGDLDESLHVRGKDGP